MRSPFAPLPFLLFLALLSALLLIVQLELFRIAFERLGLSRNSALVLLLTSLFSSAINIPLFKVPSLPPPIDAPFLRWRGMLGLPPPPFTGFTVVALNIGGCLIPVLFSIYLLAFTPVPVLHAAISTIVVSPLCYFVSRPVAGVGIAMPIFVAPVAAAAVALLLNPAHSAPLAYIGGTLGVLIGADLLRLGTIKGLGAPIASIGGAGTFDGIFLTGVVAVLLA